MNLLVEYLEDPLDILGQFPIDLVSSTLEFSSSFKIDQEILHTFVNLPYYSSLILWIAIVPLIYFILVGIFRYFNVLPNPVRAGSRGSDIMAFEIVAGCCVLYLSVAGIIGLFEVGVKPFSSNDNLQNLSYSRSSFIENHLLVPMLSYQSWNLLLCLTNKDLYSKEMVIHHFLAALSAVIGLIPYFQWFSLYFYGIVEITNLPLTIVDIFKIFPIFQDKYPIVDQIAKITFAISFFSIRLLFWPYYLYLLWKTSIDLFLIHQVHIPIVTLIIMMLSIPLTSLQYYWGYRIIGFLLKNKKKKMLTDSENDKKTKKM